MSTKVSSGTNLTSNFFLQNFYKFNRNAVKTSTRSDCTKSELSYEDSRALKRAIAKLESFSYSEDENKGNLVSAIHAFAKTYNNVVESTSSKDSDLYRQNRKLKALAEKYGDDLKDIGITVKADGTLSVSNNVLSGSSMKKIRNVFSNDSIYMNNVQRITRHINNNSYDQVYAQMTGAGGRLNILL